MLLVAHLAGLTMRFHGRRVFFVQDLHRYQTFCLVLTELLPVLGLLGTVLGLMNTFETFHLSSQSEPDLSQMVRAFSPALSTTISGLVMVAPNLVLNAMLWLAWRPSPET
jgi:biopolymer transport protein ExbB/TolQ